MSSVGNPRRNASKRNPPATRRRALELLAGSRDGCTEAIMLAHGFPIASLEADFPYWRRSSPQICERL
jgi:hypothetical protein